MRAVIIAAVVLGIMLLLILGHPLCERAGIVRGV